MLFSPSADRTVGVEWELQLLDPLSLDLIDGIMPLMEFFPNTTYVKPEYIQSCVELTSCVAGDSDEAVRHLKKTLIATMQRCTELEMSACGSGTHPFCRRLALITPLPRYQRMEKASGYPAHRQITFSTHVHIGMQSGDEAIRVMSRLIPALPAFIALSANSPFWRGHETGHAAYRHQILAAASNYGLPPHFDSWQDYDRFLTAAKHSGMIEHFKDVHWDVRPHPDFGTLEIRAMDAAPDLQTLHGLVAFTRSIVIWLTTASDAEVSQILPPNLPIWANRQNRFRAAKDGLNAEYIVNDAGDCRPLSEMVAELIEHCYSTAAQINETQGLSIASEMLNDRSGFELQLRAFRENNSARAVVKYLQQTLADSIADGGAIQEVSAHDSALAF